MRHYFSKEYISDTSFPLHVRNEVQLSRVDCHDHEFIEIALVSHGSAIHHTYQNDSRLSYGVVLGDVFSVLPGEAHGYSEGQSFYLYNIFFHMDLLKNELEELSSLRSWHTLLSPDKGAARKKLHLPCDFRISAENALKRVIREMKLQREGYRFYAKLALLEALVIISRAESMEWKAFGNPRNIGLLHTISLMEDNPAETLHLEYLAGKAGMSISSYTKKFREMTGLSPLDYQIRLKIDQARTMLAETDLPIAEIAFQCGFCDTNYMTKLFRLRQGVTPDKYRQKLKTYK